MKNFCDNNLSDWQEWVQEQNLPPYRAKQLFAWSCKGIDQVDKLTNLPLQLRSLLAESFIFEGLTILSKLESKLDATKKYIFKLADGNIIESVLMQYAHGYSVCLSSQAGCKMGCKFCASTAAGFGRNLSAGEMLLQIALISQDLDIRIGNIVIMGIGEPLDNYDQVLKFLRLVNDQAGFNIGFRHISLSTCGLVPGMLKFSDEGLPVTLSVSLHAPDQKVREKLMPIAHVYRYDQLLAACRDYTKKTGRRVSFEYTLFRGLNDHPQQARKLARQLKNLMCHVNLIKANETECADYKAADDQTLQNFRQVLLQAGINATIRRELGTDIMAACGQLRRSLEICESR